LPQIIKEEWSARKIEQFIVQLKKSGDTEQPASERNTEAQHAHEADTKQLAQRLSADVRIKTNARGAGQIVIRFSDEKDFERLQKILGS
jgi:ParB-like chromosome segregation protein Spo0J